MKSLLQKDAFNAPHSRRVPVSSRETGTNRLAQVQVYLNWSLHEYSPVLELMTLHLGSILILVEEENLVNQNNWLHSLVSQLSQRTKLYLNTNHIFMLTLQGTYTINRVLYNVPQNKYNYSTCNFDSSFQYLQNTNCLL